jgi:diadenosine tetraphosphatase ApaH/serine/threonine PP2A family protein phosphatase
VCLGDIVGYGAEPSECLEVVQARCSIFIQGNHDAVAYDYQGIEWFNPLAADALRWTHQQLSTDQLQFLGGLPSHVVDEIPFFDGVRLAFWHGAPHSGWSYARMRPLPPTIEEDRNNGTLSLMGHTHVPQFWVNREERPEKLVDAHEKHADELMLYNVGSVGQPRDRDPRAAYVIADHERGTLTVHRVKYNVDRAAEKIEAAGLPIFLADRLFEGR